MTTYRPRSDVRVEAKQWGNTTTDDHASPYRIIVDWVNDNGGEARYEPPCSRHVGQRRRTPPRIAVRTINGWAYAAPGHYVVMGSEWFPHTADNPSRVMGPHEASVRVRDFYPCDPATFESRWEIDA